MKKLLALFILPLLVAGSLSPVFAPSASAVTAADWRAGRIIDDSKFTGLDMSVADIQNFLNNKVPVCDTWGTQPASEYGRSDITHAQYAASKGWPGPPYVCLKNYHEVPKTAPGPGVPANSYGNGGNPPAGSISAAQMIYNAAQTHRISPKVLLVKLATESAGPLTTDKWPLQKQYTYAMGAYCPDSGPGGSANCNTNYAGFSIQMSEAAELLRWYLDSMTQPWWQYKKPFQSNYVMWNVAPRGCGGTNVYLETMGTAALYTYTPYQPNQAALNNMYGTGDNCSAYGNRNFWRVYSDWFGSLSGPAAFTVPGSGIIYIPFGQYKYRVPYAAAMQDYGISWEAVQNVSQAYADSIPLAPGTSGISQSISHVVKTPSDSDADGGSIYLISLGKRYQFESMQQFFNFGFSEASISYLPMDLIFTKSNAGVLPNYITSPRGSVFQVSTLGKRIIFEYGTYIANNPGDRIASLSYFLADNIVSGIPIADKPILLKYSTGDSLLLFSQGTYNAVQTYDTYQCWGFDSTLRTPVYRLPQNDYIAPVSSPAPLACTGSISGNPYVLSRGQRVTIPPTIFSPTDTFPANVSNILNSLPLRSTALSNFVTIPNSSGVWYINSEKKRVIPTYNTFLDLGLSASKLDLIPAEQLEKLTDDGILLSNGQLVKDPSSSAVYVVDNNKRYGFPTSDLFLAYKNSWVTIDPINSQALDTNYPYDSNVTPLLVNKSSNTAYFVAGNGCFALSGNDLTTLGVSLATASSSQKYESTVFKNITLSTCKPATPFIRSATQSLVYYLENGKKRPVLTFTAMLQKNGGTEPTVMVLDSIYINSLPNGDSIQ